MECMIKESIKCCQQVNLRYSLVKLIIVKKEANVLDCTADWYFQNKAVTLNISIMHTEKLIIKYWVVFTSHGVKRQL